MPDLDGRRVVLLLGKQYEDDEASMPIEFLHENGANVVVVGTNREVLKGLHGRSKIAVDLAIDEAGSVDGYDAMVIPGGRGPANLRKNPEVVEFVKEFSSTGRPIAAICHGPQLLETADLLDGRKLTSYPGIRQEMVRAGAEWEDSPVVVDGNLITSRRPADMDDFTRELARALAKAPATQVSRHIK